MEKVKKCNTTIRYFAYRLIGKSRIYNRWFAGRLASNSHRLDLSCAQIAMYLNFAGLSGKLPLRNKICLELGCGWVLSHTLVLHLLGAKSVISTDVERLAYPTVLHKSIHKSVPYIVRDVLASDN